MPPTPGPSGSPLDPANLSPEDQKLVAQMKEAQEIQQAYLRQAFRWLIDYVSNFFPEDQLAMEDQGRDVHFLHIVMEKGKPLGVLVYRLPKFPDKEALYKDLAEEYRGELGMPEVLFVDTETGKFGGTRSPKGTRSTLRYPPRNSRPVSVPYGTRSSAGAGCGS